MKRFRVWNGGVSAIAAVLVFILTYMLILPAITMTKDPTCGMEEHTHSEECYETRTVKRIACPYDEFDGLVLHKHDENCYDETGELICKLEETIQDETVEEPEALLAAEEIVLEAEPTQTPSQELAPEEEIVAPEETTEESLVEEPVLVNEEIRSEDLAEPALVQEEETPAEEEAILSEEAALLEDETVGEENEEEDITHLHTVDCYDVFGNLICGKQQVVYHQHDETCFRYEEEKVLICGKQEHAHTDACYDTIEEHPEEVISPIPEETEGVIPDEEDVQLASEEGVLAEEDAMIVEEETAPIEYITQDVAGEETEDGIVFFLEPRPEEEEAIIETSEEEGFELAEDETDQSETLEEMTEITEEESSVLAEEEELVKTEESQSELTAPVEEEALVEESLTDGTEDGEAAEESLLEEELQDIAEEELSEETGEEAATQVHEEEAVLGEETAVSDEETEIEEENLSEETTVEEEEAVEEEALETQEEEGLLGLDEELTEEDDEDIILDSKPEQKSLIYNGLDYHVTLSYEEGIPDGATLEVREIKGTEFESYLASAKENLGVKILPASLARFFDITILLDGEEIEPTSAVQVQISYDEPVRVDGKLNILHFEDEENVTVFSTENAEAVTEEDTLVDSENETEVIQEEVAVETEEEELLDAILDEEMVEETDVAFEAESFSVYGIVYTMDFETLQGGTYAIEGGTTISLPIVLYSLGFAPSVPILDVWVSDSTIVNAMKTEGEWKLQSMRPFDGEEALEIYFEDGTLIKVTVVDAKISEWYLSSEGSTYYISVSYGPEAKIPDGSSLSVREIKSDTKEYQDLLQDAQDYLESGEKIDTAMFFDISILDPEGTEVQPEAEVDVRIQLVEGIGNNVKTLHFNQADEAPSVVENSVSENVVSFKTDGF